MAERPNKEKIEESEEKIEPEGSSLLRTHELINTYYSGELKELREGYAKVSLLTSEEMRVDSYGLVHGGFIFCAADFAAMAAVNNPNVVLSTASCTFLSPVRVYDEVIFTAKLRQKEGRKREVTVLGHVMDIKVFEASMKTVILDKHVLKLDLMNAIKE
jgi:acyl-CoA thioesterase